jgi:hypothetical protein
MSLPERASTVETPAPYVDLTDIVETGGLYDTPASALEREELAAHIGRKAFHGCKDRNFQFSYKANDEGKMTPTYYRVGTSSFEKCQYVQLTSKQYSAVLVVDIDVEGEAGGKPQHLNSEVKQKIGRLVSCGWGPAWVGINPVTGKSQAIWLIEPVYADEKGDSSNVRLLQATCRTLGQWLDGDPRFSHRFSRSPFYTGKDPTAYKWYRQHNHVVPLGILIKVVRNLSGIPETDTRLRQQFSSGRELINAVKARREEAQRFKALAQDVETEIGDSLDKYDPELVEGVRILWISEGRAARDETAFRHALKTAHRLRAAGERMTDAAIIDAYEHAYGLAQKLGANGRPSEMPPMRDRETMARRVRGYVLGSKTGSMRATGNAAKATAIERKALATMGRKGGKKAAERWKTDPDGDYAQGRRKVMEQTHKRKKIQGLNSRQKIGQFVTSFWIETNRLPTWKEIQTETGLSRATVARHVAALKEAGEIPTT